MKAYWTAEIYGFGKWIRRYGYYPRWLPLCIYTDHGAGCNENLPAKHELESDSPVQFYHCQKTAFKFHKLNPKKRCYVIFSPFVFARKKLRIQKKGDAKGTLFFIAHSTLSLHDRKEVKEYHEELLSIPDQYRPVTICLHMHDMNKGVNKLYQRLGYEVVSAGDSLDKKFTERFYSILARHQYSISNMIGSYLYYSIEMGVPFGLFGSKPRLYNEGDPNIEQGVYESFSKHEWYTKGEKLFSNLPTLISDDQKEFAEYGLGMKNGINRTKMALVLYLSFFKWIGRPKNLVRFCKSVI